jgi:signal recognition particle subunit SRP54
VLGEQLGIEVYSNREEKNPVRIAQDAVIHARSKGFNVVIVDTAGRLAVDEQMMDEIARVKSAIQPSETLFVVDSMTGQDAVNTAKAFNEKINFDGVVLTKLDGDTRGGAALSVKAVVNKPIKFVGTGEKMDALDIFYPKRMADRILGMGDVVSLVEKAQEQFDEEDAKRLQKKIMKDQFDLNDFLAQLQQIKKMGNVKDLMGMIPGMGKAMKGVDVPEDAFKGVEAIILSMTPKERSNPGILNTARKNRIANGSGTNIQEINKLLKQFDEMRKMMKMMSNPRNMTGMMSRLKGMGGMPGM